MSMWKVCQNPKANNMDVQVVYLENIFPDWVLFSCNCVSSNKQQQEEQATNQAILESTKNIFCCTHRKWGQNNSLQSQGAGADFSVKDRQMETYSSKGGRRKGECRERDPIPVVYSFDFISRIVRFQIAVETVSPWEWAPCCFWTLRMETVVTEFYFWFLFLIWMDNRWLYPPQVFWFCCFVHSLWVGSWICACLSRGHLANPARARESPVQWDKQNPLMAASDSKLTGFIP